MELQETFTPYVRDQFIDENGRERILKAYDWKTYPPIRSGERLFNIQDGAVTYGWVSLTKQPLCSEYLQSTGIYSNYQGKGLMKLVRILAMQKVFEEFGAERLSIHILDTNKEYQEHFRTHLPPGWKHGGHVWYPEPAYKIFTITYDAWNENKPKYLCR